MVDAIRIIDLWQVILQEPRVAAQEAAMLMQGEIEQQMLVRQREQQRRQNERRVRRARETELEGIPLSRRSSGAKKTTGTAAKRSAKSAGGRLPAAARSGSHIDTLI